MNLTQAQEAFDLKALGENVEALSEFIVPVLEVLESIRAEDETALPQALAIHHEILALRKKLSSIEKTVETWCAERLRLKRTDVAGVGIVERRGGVDYKEWDDRLTAIEVIAPALGGDLELVGAVLDLFLRAASVDWRVTPLKEWWGKDEDGRWVYLDYCKTTTTRKTLHWVSEVAA